MGMSDHDKQQVVQEFFAKKVSFSWNLENGKTGFFCFIRVREVANMSKICLHIPSGGSVAHYFKLLYNLQYRTTERTASNR